MKSKNLDFINSLITNISPTFESEWSNYPGINFCSTPQISEIACKAIRWFCSVAA